MKSIPIIWVIGFLSLVFIIFTITEEIKLSKFKWLKENTYPMSSAERPTPLDIIYSGRLLVLYADLNILVILDWGHFMMFGFGTVQGHEGSVPSKHQITGENYHLRTSVSATQNLNCYLCFLPYMIVRRR